MFFMRQQLAVLAFLCAALTISFAQQSTAPAAQSGTSPAPSSPRKQAAKPPDRGNQPRPDVGSVIGETYSERYFNLSCTIPQGWVVRTDPMKQGLVSDDNSILLLSTFAKQAPDVNAINPSLTITAESLALYPQVRTAEDYFDNLAEIVTSKGFTVINAPAEIEVGGVTFLRGDFQKQDGTATVYQASMVAIRKGYALSVNAISGNEEQLTPLLNRVRILAPPTLGKP